MIGPRESESYLLFSRRFQMKLRASHVYMYLPVYTCCTLEAAVYIGLDVYELIQQFRAFVEALYDYVSILRGMRVLHHMSAVYFYFIDIFAIR